MEDPLFLPLGISDFSTLRNGKQIYVDKTKFVYELARLQRKFFLARPRRFGKSLLLSTFESLFKFGLRDFRGLAIEKLWTEDKKYQVVRLDFSECKSFDSLEVFSQQLDCLLRNNFGPLGFVYRNDGTTVCSQLSRWLKTIASGSMVILIDEYDAPLTTCLNNAELFDNVRSTMATFYSVLKSNDAVIRFLFMTGISKFNKVSIFSELNNLVDITLHPDYGTMLGYTLEELHHYFGDFLEHASEIMGIKKENLVETLTRSYDGFCFDELAQHKVFAPWSVLNFLSNPQLGFKNYWFESGGKPSILLQYMKSHSLRKPDFYAAQKSIQLAELSGSSSMEGLSDVGLLTQAGYLTIKKVEYGTAFLGFPNSEVQSSMAQLYTEQLLGGRSIVQAGAGGLITELIRGNTEEVFHLLNKAFLGIDYTKYCIGDESMIRTFVQLFLSSFGLQTGVEVHNNKGRSDLELRAGERHWVFEFKVCRADENEETKLNEAVFQILDKDYGLQHKVNYLTRVAMVYSIEKRKFVKWKAVPN